MRKNDDDGDDAAERTQKKRTTTNGGGGGRKSNGASSAEGNGEKPPPSAGRRPTSSAARRTHHAHRTSASETTSARRRTTPTSSRSRDDSSSQRRHPRASPPDEEEGGGAAASATAAHRRRRANGSEGRSTATARSTPRSCASSRDRDDDDDDEEEEEDEERRKRRRHDEQRGREANGRREHREHRPSPQQQQEGERQRQTVPQPSDPRSDESRRRKSPRQPTLSSSFAAARHEHRRRGSGSGGAAPPQNAPQTLTTTNSTASPPPPLSSSHSPSSSSLSSSSRHSAAAIIDPPLPLPPHRRHSRPHQHLPERSAQSGVAALPHAPHRPHPLIQLPPPEPAANCLHQQQQPANTRHQSLLPLQHNDFAKRRPSARQVRYHPSTADDEEEEEATATKGADDERRLMRANANSHHRHSAIAAGGGDGVYDSSLLLAHGDGDDSSMDHTLRVPQTMYGGKPASGLSRGFTVPTPGTPRSRGPRMGRRFTLNPLIFAKQEREARRISMAQLKLSYATPDGQETGLDVCTWLLMLFSWIILLVTFPVSVCFCFKIVKEYERAVMFRLGRLVSGGAKGPGIFFILPCIESYTKVDLRTVSFSVPPQEILTRDSVTVSVDAVVYYRVSNATVSVANVENAHHSTRLLAQTTMRNMLGIKDLSELLSDRETHAHEMQEILDEATESWGIVVERVEIKDVRLPTQLQRAMAAEAEAAREARAKVIAAEGEQKASCSLREAAEVIAGSPAALQLRFLQTLNSVAAEKNSTIIFPLPVEIIRHFFGGSTKRKRSPPAALIA